MTDLAGTVRQALANEEDTSDISNTRVVIDTSVLIADPACLHSMGEADVVIPLTVIEELDGLKSRSDDVGARPELHFERLKNFDFNMVVHLHHRFLSEMAHSESK